MFMFVFIFALFLTLFVAGKAFADDLPFDSMKIVKGSSGFLYEAFYPPTEDDFFAKLDKLGKLFFSFAPACSSIRKGNLYGRNFDYDFDMFADIVIHTAAGNGHFASLALDGGMLARQLSGAAKRGFARERLNEILAGDTPSFLEKRWLKFLPYVAVDGINEKGVVCNINVAQKGAGIGLTTGTNPKAKMGLFVAFCPRFILDRCASARQAVETLCGINIWSSRGKVNPSYHLMIADEKETYAVEFRNNRMLVKEISGKPYMTNFNLLLSDTETVGFDKKGHVDRRTVINYTGSTDEDGFFDPGFARGIERYDVIADSYSLTLGKFGMRRLLDRISYAALYKKPKSRFTEFVRNNTLFEHYIPDMGDDFRFLSLESATVNMDALCEKYDIENAMRGLLSELKRGNSNFVHTVHSCVYDISARKVWVKEQELGKERHAWSAEHCFCLNEEPQGTVSRLRAMLSALPRLFRG